MDKETKIKIILISTFALLLIGVAYLFINRGDGGSKSDEEISTRAIDSAEVSISDIMTQNNKPQNNTNEYSYSPDNNYTYTPAEPAKEYEDSEDIEKLQEQLRRNASSSQRASNYDVPGYTHNSNNRSKEKEEYITDSRVVHEDKYTPLSPEVNNEKATVVSQEETPKRRNSRFNSGINSNTNSIKVSVFGDQELKNGSPIKMILTKSINLEGESIPKGTAVYGVVHSANGRMTISVSSIRYRDKAFNVSLNAYDKDGIKGINITDSDPKENTVKEVAQEVVERSGIISSAVGAVTSTVSGIFRRHGGSNAIIIKSNYILELR